MEYSPAPGAQAESLKTPGPTRAATAPLRPPPVADSPASPATTGSVWRALEELTAKHNAAVAREEALRSALTQAQKAAAGGGNGVSTAAVEEKDRALAAALARAQAAETELAELRRGGDEQRSELKGQLAQAQRESADATDTAAALRAELAQAKASADEKGAAEAEAASLRAQLTSVKSQLESAEREKAELRTKLATAPAPQPPSGGDPALVASLTSELRAAQARAESAEAQARGLEGALAQYEATLSQTLSANSRASQTQASRIGLLEAQNSRLSSEYAALLQQFKDLTERYSETKAKWQVAQQNEAKWGDRMREVEAQHKQSIATLRSAGEEAVRQHMAPGRCGISHSLTRTFDAIAPRFRQGARACRFAGDGARSS